MHDGPLCIIDARGMLRVEAARLAKRLLAAEPGLQLVAWVREAELSCGYIGFTHVVTSLAAVDKLEEGDG